MGRFDSIYARLPVFAQHGAVSTYGLYWRWLRFGYGYNHYVKEYLDREQFNLDEWQIWQRNRLQDLLRQAAQSVPYYRQTWSQSEVKAANEGRLQDLPLLDKDPIRSDPNAFCREDMKPWTSFVFPTSGSTGTPIASIWTIQEIRNSLALREARSAGWAGGRQRPRRKANGPGYPG